MTTVAPSCPSEEVLNAAIKAHALVYGSNAPYDSDDESYVGVSDIFSGHPSEASTELTAPDGDEDSDVANIERDFADERHTPASVASSDTGFAFGSEPGLQLRQSYGDAYVGRLELEQSTNALLRIRERQAEVLKAAKTFGIDDLHFDVLPSNIKGRSEWEDMLTAFGEDQRKVHDGLRAFRSDNWITNEEAKSIGALISELASGLKPTWEDCFHAELSRQRELNVVDQTLEELRIGIRTYNRNPSQSTKQDLDLLFQGRIAAMKQTLAQLSLQEGATNRTRTAPTETTDDITVRSTKGSQDRGNESRAADTSALRKSPY